MKLDKKILGSFILQNFLNPKIWENYKDIENARLKEKVRKYLMRISSKFIDYLGEDIFVEDIILTGSLSNFNWSQFSDFDIHVIVDYNQFGKNSELYKKHFDLKRQIFNDKHDIKIYGFDVELYAQDENESESGSTVFGGIYSVMNNEWIKTPKKEKFDLDTKILIEKINTWIKKINKAIKEENYESIEKLKEKLKSYRKSGLDKKGELSYENLTFKYLRRSGVIEKLFDASNTTLDKTLSIETYITEQEVPSLYEKYKDIKSFIEKNELPNKIGRFIKNNDVFKYIPDEKFKFSEDIVVLQTALDLLDYPFPEWGVDGKFGPETEKAVKLFQEKKGLPITGIMGKDDFLKLIYELYISKDKIDTKKIKLPTKTEKKTDFTYLDMNSSEGYKIYKEISDDFINSRNPNVGITGDMLAKSAKKYFTRGYVPPELALAQLAAEGGLSKKKDAIPIVTKNPYNVGNTDSGGKIYHPDFQTGIDAYFDLMTRRYLAKGKTAEELVNNFVNINGRRYASGPEYEKLLREIISGMGKYTDPVLAKYGVTNSAQI